MADEKTTPATVADRLRLGTGFSPDDRERLVSWLEAGLDRRLARWPAERVSLEVSVKQRGTALPEVTLICDIAGGKGEPARRFVATSAAATGADGHFQDAILDCRDDLRRQIDDVVTRRESSRRRSHSPRR